MRAERLVLQLRCTLPRLGASGTGNLGRERLAIRPNRPILKIFLLPDGHGPLQGFDAPMAPSESAATVRGATPACHTVLANSLRPEAGHVATTAILKIRECLSLELA